MKNSLIELNRTHSPHHARVTQSSYLLYFVMFIFVFINLQIVMAENGGFEPPIELSPYNGLANRRLQPLGQLSVCVAVSIMCTRCPAEENYSKSASQRGSESPTSWHDDAWDYIKTEWRW